MLSFISDLLGVSTDPADRDASALRLTERCGYAAAALTILPIPGSEILGVMPLHVGMVVGLGHIYGQEITEESATQLVLKIGATVGLSIVGSRLAISAAKLILPGLGGIVAAPFMFASTMALGAVARAYFKSEGALSEAEMKEVFEREKESAKKAYDPSRAKDEGAKSAATAARAAAEAPPAPKASDDPAARIRKLKGMLEEGLIDAAEFEAEKKRVLSSI